jgi:hypothetical protein
MATIIVSIIVIAMIVVGAMTLSQGVMTSADTAARSVQELSVREGDIARTGLARDSAVLPAPDTLQLTLENSGQTRLASFDKWDFIVQYYDSSDIFYVKWLPYSSGVLGNNEWQQTGIYLNGQPEAFEPNILNPQEELAMQAQLQPPAGYRAISATVVTPNGIAPVVVCGPPALTGHTETVTLSGDDYYMLKGWTAADGAAVTETTDAISGGQTGRWLLHDSSVPTRLAKHVYPLSNVNEIDTATWTVAYRGRADGWADSSYTNAFLSIDVMIKRADGTVREVIATDAARAVFTAADQWLDVSAGYNFPGYKVMDETDYLEIDFYGNSEGSGPNGMSYISLRVDDGTLPAASQTRIEGISWS